MKKFILGFISGGILTAAVTGFAVEYAVTANPYPVKVNGQAAAIEGYNINNSTYFKLRDVAEAIGGFNVDFKDNEIILETETAPSPTAIPTAQNNLKPLPKIKTITRQNKEYIDIFDIESMLKTIGLEQYMFAGHDFYLDSDPLNPILTNIPIYEDDINLIPFDYYTSTIVPVINSLR